MNWKEYKSLYPIVLVTDRRYSQNELPEQIIMIRVEDSDEAYWKFVNFYRNQFTIPVVAITGTSGKSTTKEMIKHILSAEKM